MYGYETVASDYSGYANAGGGVHPHGICVGAGTYSYDGFSSHTSKAGGTTYMAKTSNLDEPLSRFEC